MILTTYRRRGFSGSGQALSLFAWLPHKYPAIPADAADLLQNLFPCMVLVEAYLGRNGLNSNTVPKNS